MKQKSKAQPKPILIVKPKQLTAKESNRLAIEQQLIEIRLIENALNFQFKNESRLRGKVVSEGDLIRAKNELTELDRVRSIYESEAYGKKLLPYLPSNGSITEKVKAHFDELDGELLFIEVKPSTNGRIVTEHVQTKSHIKKSIKQKLMATKKAAKKKVAKTATKKVNKSTKPAKAKTEGDSIRARVEKMVGKGLNNAAIFEALNKDGIAYAESSVRWYASKARALA